MLQFKITDLYYDEGNHKVQSVSNYERNRNVCQSIDQYGNSISAAQSILSVRAPSLLLSMRDRTSWWCHISNEAKIRSINHLCCQQWVNEWTWMWDVFDLQECDLYKLSLTLSLYGNASLADSTHCPHGPIKHNELRKPMTSSMRIWKPSMVSVFTRPRRA